MHSTQSAAFEPCIANLFNQSSGRNVVIKTKVDLREVILLDSQSKIDFFKPSFSG